MCLKIIERYKLITIVEDLYIMNNQLVQINPTRHSQMKRFFYLYMRLRKNE